MSVPPDAVHERCNVYPVDSTFGPYQSEQCENEGGVAWELRANSGGSQGSDGGLEHEVNYCYATSSQHIAPSHAQCALGSSRMQLRESCNPAQPVLLGSNTPASREHNFAGKALAEEEPVENGSCAIGESEASWPSSSKQWTSAVPTTCFALPEGTDAVDYPSSYTGTNRPSGPTGDTSFANGLPSSSHALAARMWLSQRLDEPFSDGASTLLCSSLLLSILVGLAISTLEQPHPDSYPCWTLDSLSGIAELLVNVVYTIEFLFRLWCSRLRWQFLRTWLSMFDIASLVLFWIVDVSGASLRSGLPLLGAMRPLHFSLRLLKVFRFSHVWSLVRTALEDAHNAVLLSVAALAILVGIGGCFVCVAEGRDVFPRLTDAFMYSFTCIVTNDIGPWENGVSVETFYGRALILGLSMCGQMIFAMAIAWVGMVFCRTWFQKDRLLFVGAVRRHIDRRCGYSEKELRRFFGEYTRQHTRHLDFRDFRILVKDFRPQANHATIMTLFSCFDQDVDSAINFDDFHASIYPEMVDVEDNEEHELEVPETFIDEKDNPQVDTEIHAAVADYLHKLERRQQPFYTIAASAGFVPSPNIRRNSRVKPLSEGPTISGRRRSSINEAAETASIHSFNAAAQSHSEDMSSRRPSGHSEFSACTFLTNGVGLEDAEALESKQSKLGRMRRPTSSKATASKTSSESCSKTAHIMDDRGGSAATAEARGNVPSRSGTAAGRQNCAVVASCVPQCTPSPSTPSQPPEASTQSRMRRTVSLNGAAQFCVAEAAPKGKSSIQSGERGTPLNRSQTVASLTRTSQSGVGEDDEYALGLDPRSAPRRWLTSRGFTMHTSADAPCNSRLATGGGTARKRRYW